MRTVCVENNCAGCKMCTDICPKNAIAIEDEIIAYNAVIDLERCINCNLCHQKCPQNNPPTKRKPMEWFQGFYGEEKYRVLAPSGGAGIAMMRYFASDGGYVVSCAFKDGKFCFDIEKNPNKVLRFIGSKYVKSDPEGLFKKIAELLKNGNKVLFIGLPCQCAALRNYINENNSERLYLVDLICHGTPSPKLLEMFLRKYSKSLDSIKKIDFRIKAKMQIVIDDKGIVCKGVTDKYTIGFLNGLTYTENCYKCNYASENRCTDITIGDSWGTEMIEETKKGLSLILVQTQKGLDLLKKAGIKLYPVDETNAKRNNGQLLAPMKMPKRRSWFFNSIDSDNFNKRIFRLYAKDSLKQDIKYMLIKLGLVK